jgi:hypothetical protein
MVVGLFLIAICCGLVATIASVAFSVPLWTALLAYPIVGIIGLLMLGIGLFVRPQDDGEMATVKTDRLASRP